MLSQETYISIQENEQTSTQAEHGELLAAHCSGKYLHESKVSMVSLPVYTVLAFMYSLDIFNFVFAYQIVL